MENKTQDKKYILWINLFMQIVFCFFSVFFNIFVFEISQDLNIVILYTITNFVASWLFNLILLKAINKKFLTVMFRLSFLLCFVCTVLTFFINGQRLWLVFVVQILYALTIDFYYIPSEVSTMTKNTKGQMKKFMGLYSALSVFAAVISPFLSGYIIDFGSYYILLGIMMAFIVVCFGLSTKLKLVTQDVGHVSLKEYLGVVRQDKGVQYGYVGYSINKFSMDGPIETLLPILLFLRTGTNYSVGNYSALAALIASMLLLIYAYFGKRKELMMWICSAAQVVISLMILLSGSVVVFFIYYFIMKIVSKLLHNGINSSLMTIVNHTPLRKYKVEQHFAYHTLSIIVRVFSCGLCLVFYNFLNNEISLVLFLAVTAAFQLLSTFFVCKSDRMLQNVQPYEEEMASENEKGPF